MVEVEERVKEENKGPSKRRRTGARLYSICRKTGYNTRTYPDTRTINSSNDSK